MNYPRMEYVAICAALAWLAMGSPARAASQGVWKGPQGGTIATVPAESLPPGLRQSFVEYEAEALPNTGSTIGPDRRFGTLAAEASGRRAVLLRGPGQILMVRLAQAANALTVRYAIADSPDGRGRDGTIGVYVGARRIATVPVTSRYGWFYGHYPFTNRPSDGGGHHFFDHGRVLLSKTFPAGAVLTLKLDRTPGVDWIAIDLVDVELAPPPLPPPARALSLAEFGADPKGVGDSSAALRNAIAAAGAEKRPLWLPPGRFRIDGHFAIDQIEIGGAGMWRTTLFGHAPGLYGLGQGRQSTGVWLHDFAIISDVTDRDDKAQVNAIGGAMGSGSRIERLWLQHAKVGLWFDGPMDGIRISGLRIFDMTADGLNFHRAVSNATAERSFVRGVGDDGLASWAGGGQNRNIVFRDNVVVAPILANGIAVYGGEDITVVGNLIADTLTEGGGIHVGNRFAAAPVSGTIRIEDNTVVRGGSLDPWRRFGLGAIWFYALDAPINAHIRVRNLTLRDSSYDAVLFLGSSIGDVEFDGLRVEGGGGPLVTLRSAGRAALAHVISDGVKVGRRICDAGFDLTIASAPSFPIAADTACGR